MFEDVPDNRRVFNTADDPHGALTIRADQGIYLPGLRECVVMSLRVSVMSEAIFVERVEQRIRVVVRAVEHDGALERPYAFDIAMEQLHRFLGLKSCDDR